MKHAGRSRFSNRRQEQEHRVRRLFRRCVVDAQLVGLPVNVGQLTEAKLCHRRNDIGVCRRSQCAEGVKFTVCFSDFYLALTDDEVLNVLMHEVIHTLPDCWDHGDEFIHWMDVVNDQPVNGHVYRVVTSNVGDDARRLRAACEAALTADHPHMVTVECPHGCSITVSCRSRVARHPELFECKEHGASLHLRRD